MYVSIVRSCWSHNSYCNFLYPNNFIGVFCIRPYFKKADFIESTLDTLIFQQLILFTITLGVNNKYYRIANIKILALVCPISKLATKFFCLVGLYIEKQPSASINPINQAEK